MTSTKNELKTYINVRPIYHRNVTLRSESIINITIVDTFIRILTLIKKYIILK